MRSTLLSPIQRSGLSLPTSAVRPCSLARRPTLEGTSPTTLRSGPRWSSSQGLRRIDAAEHSINPVLRTVRGTDVRELPRTRRVALRELALRCWRARRLRPTCPTSTVSGRWTGQRRRVRCAAPAAFLYVCGVKKHTQLVTQRADGPLRGLSLSSGYISPARAAFGGKAVMAPSATSPRLMTVPLG